MNEIFTADELADYLRIKKNTIYIWVSQKRIPYTKIGRCTRFKRSEIDRWIKENEVYENELLYRR
ncbi:helix-turn-helix domain-containing protein [Elusimicrobiota bacterium]